MKGSYILLIELPDQRTITIGRLKAILFRQGSYAYVGSAMGGLESRLNYHFKADKKPHWHIDYLLPHAAVTGAVLYETSGRVECQIAHALSHELLSIPHFGSSDCGCESHLFFAVNQQQLTSLVMSLNLPDIKPVLMPVS